MHVNKFDIMHHKITVGKARNGDITAFEAELHNALTCGIKNKCPDALDFIKRMNARNKNKQFFMQKNHAAIIKFIAPIHRLFVTVIISSISIASIVEAYYA